MKKYPEFQQIIKKFEEDQKSSTCLNLEAYLIMPVQRVPRYILLLKDLIKYTWKEHNDYDQLNRVMNNISATLTSINSTIDKEYITHARKMLEVEKSIDGKFETLVHPSRRFVREGPLLAFQDDPNIVDVEKDGKESMRHRTRTIRDVRKQDVTQYFFLFNDIFVYCKQKKQEKRGDKLFDFVHTMDLNQISSVVDIPLSEKKEEGPSAFGLKMTTNHSWTFVAKDNTEKHAWMKEIIVMIMNREKDKIQLKKSGV